MTNYIALLGTVLALRMLARRGLEHAMLRVWLPAFLCFPFNFTVKIVSGIPVLNIMQTAILPVLALLLRDKRSDMKLGTMEKLLAVYVLFRVFADFLGRGYSDAQNYAFYMLTVLIGPYLIGRYVIDRREMDIATARAFVLIFVIWFPMFCYELKFWTSPVFTVFGRFFPDAGSGLSLRYGLARTAGPFGHPILACVMIVTVYRLHRWLTWMGEWQQPQPGWLGKLEAGTRWMWISLSSRISVLLVLMALMTISRGPWIGGCAGAALAMVGNARNRKKALIIFVLVLGLGSAVGKMALDDYITPAQGEAISGEAQTMLYRKEMVDRYREIMYQKMWFGWGLTTSPKIKGMESVDNAFFLMVLQHGVIALAIFVGIFACAIITQIRYGLAAPAKDPPLGFTFAGIYLAAFISFATVYMGSQTEPLLFFLLGWGESVKNRREVTGSRVAIGATPAARPPFRRILC